MQYRLNTSARLFVCQLKYKTWCFSLRYRQILPPYTRTATMRRRISSRAKAHGPLWDDPISAQETSILVLTTFVPQCRQIDESGWSQGSAAPLEPIYRTIGDITGCMQPIIGPSMGGDPKTANENCLVTCSRRRQPSRVRAYRNNQKFSCWGVDETICWTRSTCELLLPTCVCLAESRTSWNVEYVCWLTIGMRKKSHIFLGSSDGFRIITHLFDCFHT